MTSEEQIKDLAYAIWDQDGRPEGRDLDYYFRAKQVLEEREAASSAAKEPPAPPTSILRPELAPKPVVRHAGKRRSKKT
jgi:hypothetical protein